MTEPEAIDPRSSLVKVSVGGQVLDAIYVPNCKTCTHPARVAIEEKVLLNYTYPEISRMYSGRLVEGESGDDLRLPDVSWQSIRNHYKKKHMPLEHAAAARLVEKRAEELGEAIESATDRVLDARTVADTVMQKGYDRIQQGIEAPDVKDTLAAVKLLADIDERTGNRASTDDAWSTAMQVYFETARRMMPPEMWTRFTRELSTNPVLRALEAKQNDDNVIDAEVVET